MNKPIRLFWNESYAPKPLLVQAIIEQAAKKSIASLNQYPGELYDDVIWMIAEDFGVGIDQVILGHGVEGLIHLVSRAFLSGSKAGGTFDPSYFVFENNIARYKDKGVRFPAHYQKKVDVQKFMRAIEKTAVFYLASPNKETGNYLLSTAQIETVLKQYKGIFVVDECYYGLGQKTTAELLKKHKNLVIMRSVSKAEGLAGLRVGIALAHTEIIAKLKYYQNDIEYDPINTFALHILQDIYPKLPKIWKSSQKFFDDFYAQLKRRFPQNKIIKTVVTHHFFSTLPSKVEPYEVIERMNKAGYLLAPRTPTDSSSRYTVFPGLLALTPPPIEYWGDYLGSLEKAVAREG